MTIDFASVAKLHLNRAEVTRGCMWVLLLLIESH